jgi:hypothetical protein
MVACAYLIPKHICLFLPLSMYILQANCFYRRTCGSGHWDKGETQIDIYQKEHKCNSICWLLQLEQSYGDGSVHTHPLRYGFSN